MAQFDFSDKDRKYFIDHAVYNCPFCNRRNIKYSISNTFEFWWTRTRKCYGYLVQCSDCQFTSLHLSNYNLATVRNDIPGYTSGFVSPAHEVADDEEDSISGGKPHKVKPLKNKDGSEMEIDDAIFHKQPTAFFTIDSRIPEPIRIAVNEADNCRVNNFLTGGSAAIRKAIYELLKNQQISAEDASGNRIDYDERIKQLKVKLPHVDPDHFDTLKIIKGVASDHLHEDSWEDFDNPTLKLLIETTKEVLYEIYVEPDEQKNRKSRVQKLREAVLGSKK